MAKNVSIFLILLTCCLIAFGCAAPSTVEEPMVSEKPAETPIPFDEFTWPDYWPLPQPESNKGEILNDNSFAFQVNVGDTSKETFNEYIEQCRDAGFDQDHRRQDLSYTAYNADRYWLIIDYQAGSVMYVSVRTPEK